MIAMLFRVLDPAGQAMLRRTLVGLVLGAVLQGVGFVLLVPLLRVLLGPDPAAAWPWLAAMAAVFVVYGACHWDSTMSGYRTGSGLSRVLHHRLGDHVASLPLGWFDVRRTGQLAQLTSKSVVDVMGLPAHLLRPVVTAFVTPAVLVLAMLALEWRLGLAALVSLPLLAGTYRLTAHLVGSADGALDAAVADGGGRVVEFAQTQPVLRAFRRTSDGHALLDDALVAQHAAARRLLLTAVPGFLAFVLVVQLAFTFLLLLGTYLVLGGRVEVPELLAMLVLAARFVEPMITAADLGGALRMARQALERVEQVLATPALPEPAVPAQPRDAGVELREVSFGYEPGAPVLRGVSLSVPPRSMTALVGPSGSGKTTLTRLVARFFDVDTGAVLVGGVDVRELGTEALMSGVSMVFQDVYLFSGTIAENIALGRPGATAEQVREAGRTARVDEVVDRLPLGWDTPVGEGGARLSGGERQRVSIARALLKDAPIVLLDEATAALDPENEAAVQQALGALTADRTLIVVAHRLQTVAAADQIAVLDGGRIVEVGTHAELLDRGGRYADFWVERSRAQGWRLAGARTAAATPAGAAR